jgi:hypothetical protein
VRIILGIGNPGPAYQDTRHNCGFLVVEELASRPGRSPQSEDQEGDAPDAPSASRQPARPATRPDDDTAPTPMSAPTSEGPDEDIPF